MTLGNKIFVSVASYRDSELPLTINSIVQNAKYPEDLHISIVQQSLEKEWIDFQLPCRVSDTWIHAREAKGAGYARSLAQRAYDGEDYYLQVDSHTRMSEGWDVDLIDIYKESVKLADTHKVVLSQFPAAYTKGSNNKDIYLYDHPRYTDKPTQQILLWTKKRAWSAKRKVMDTSTPQESETVLAGFLFAPGTIVEEVPYDPEISFFGEELCFTIRAWTRGWKIYSPNKMVISHFYNRQNHHKIWDSRNNADKKWGKIEKSSMLKQAKIYNGDDLGIWGAYSKEALDNYIDFVGVDIPKTYNQMLHNRKLISETQVEQDIFPSFESMLSKAASVLCLDGDHAKCKVKGCECECH